MIASNSNTHSKNQLFLALFFTLFTVIALGIDSVFFYENYFDGRNIANILAIIYFLLLFFYSELFLRKLMFTMVFLSYIGELIFCKFFGMYDYRTAAIPIYVPFGHAIVYASGYIYAHSFWALKNEIQLRKIFKVGFLALFLGVGIFLNDWFTLTFGGFFFWLLKRKQWNNLYYFIALCVVFIEVVGTHFRCWAWAPKTFGIIPEVNPPMGAVFFYAGGDVLLAKIVRLWDTKNLKRV